MEDFGFINFMHNVKKITGIDLNQYKQDQMKRRLISMYQKHGYNSFDEFFNGMEKDKELVQEFLDHMTINVTEFFRNPSQWEVLQKKIIPRLYNDNEKVKAWSAACSTGEEPYSLAMLLDNMNLLKDQILATDLDFGVIKKAVDGIYNHKSLHQIPISYRNRYFRKQGLNFEIIESLKKKIKYARHNLLKDSFDTNYDLIICRNVMIYFTEEAKDLLYQKFSDALRPGGVLFVGSTEQIFKPERYGFEIEETFFYKKN
ncbi:CheR family methyltransferase [Neobacillus citreus]|uniref:protein-glutamate O-methyltransferase n=1 Tax=Neobacillus citreus TaxID=2833578 RepID=A0A942SUG8_9BACI|nr:protein-glutamate O-methyltransferase CheR [Neobacillus citreus]MCH6263933.1 protein-glutamate O-methyltransferase CheR [Neobacillus citreus]